MAYAEDAVKAKLSALNETQESIVSVAQWVMFHRRHAERTGQIWLTKLKDSSSNKRLNLVYLANEVAQQSKARRRDEFLTAFQPILVEAISVAYRGATSDIQSKLRRVIEVWRQRQIFDPPLLDALEAKAEELDKSRSSGKRPALGGSLFSSSSSSTPPELQSAAKNQTDLSKALASTTSSVPQAETEYTKLTDPATPIPTPPVYAARLSSLLKSLTAAESALSATLSARRSLLTDLEALVASNKTALASEETQHATFLERRDAIDNKKKSVEDSILKGLSAEESSPGDPRANGRIGSMTPGLEIEGPDVEALTPPPEEALTPAATIAADSGAESGAGPETQSQEADYEPAPHQEFVPPVAAPPPMSQAGADLLSSLNLPGVRQWSGSPDGGVSKRRKLDDDAGFAGGDALADLDEDVAELLRQEGGGR